MAKTEKSAKEHEQIQKDLKDVKGNVENLAESGSKNAVRKARQAGETVRHWFSDQRDRALDLRDNTEQRIKKSPFTSTALAFAAGALLASLLRRR